MLRESSERPPEGPEFPLRAKARGFRSIPRKSGRSTLLWSRNQKDFTRWFRDVAKAIASSPNDTVIDGEIVALDENGRRSFNLLRGFGEARAIVLNVFDLLMLRAKTRGLGRLRTAARSSAKQSNSCRPTPARHDSLFRSLQRSALGIDMGCEK